MMFRHFSQHVRKGLWFGKETTRVKTGVSESRVMSTLRWPQSNSVTQMSMSSSMAHMVTGEADQSLEENPTVKKEEFLPKADWASYAQSTRPKDRSEQLTRQFSLEQQQEHEIMEDVEENQDDWREWLRGYEIPEEAFQECRTVEEIEEVKRMYARQLQMEDTVKSLARNKYFQSIENVKGLGRGSSLSKSKSFIREWHPVLVEAIEEEFRAIRQRLSGEDRMIYGPMMALLDAKTLSVLTICESLNATLDDVSGNGVTLIKLATAIGKAVEDELQFRLNKGESERKRLIHAKDKFIEPIEGEFKRKTNEAFDTIGSWDKRVFIKLGATLFDMAFKSCKIRVRKEDSREQCGAVEYEDIKAFSHYYYYNRNRRHGMVQLVEPVLKAIVDDHRDGKNYLPFTVRHLPMLVPPRPWKSEKEGGYLHLQTKVMRHRDSALQMQCVKTSDISRVFDALNALAEVPWVIYDEVYEVMKSLWKEGGGFGDLPSRTDLPLPEEPLEDKKENPEVWKQYYRLKFKVEQKNRELHSLRCDTVYKLQVAEEFRKEKQMFYPYNMDFRGRVYPIPPNLNHLGSDMCRSLLIFRDAQPLGKTGLRWLKIHLANLMGVDKVSFEDREAYVNNHLEDVLDSARDPLNGKGWWKQAESPFLALGTCFDLARAIQSSDPEKYMSRIPVHQDGSCNGLQHYAALGRDSPGAKQVNLSPSNKPQDVYSGVASRVIEKIENDAKYVPKEGEAEDSPSMLAKKHATFLMNKITRKVVKQTVMTSVYGVTYVGARKQIQSKLEDIFISDGRVVDSQLENDIYHASCYAAYCTISSMNNLFTSARKIMDWLGECARIVGEEGMPMSWVTPMGLPVVQPYRRAGGLQIRTKMQCVVLNVTDMLPVSSSRQKSAFPPNYVHSLDSTHMMKTALECKKNQITFAAVHDSYWTHPSTVDDMNAILRDQFIALYDQPILEHLHRSLQLRFPNIQFPPIPDRGDFNLEEVRDSPYFFN